MPGPIWSVRFMQPDGFLDTVKPSQKQSAEGETCLALAMHNKCLLSHSEMVTEIDSIKHKSATRLMRDQDFHSACQRAILWLENSDSTRHAVYWHFWSDWGSCKCSYDRGRGPGGTKRLYQEQSSMEETMGVADVVRLVQGLPKGQKIPDQVSANVHTYSFIFSLSFESGYHCTLWYSDRAAQSRHRHQNSILCWRQPGKENDRLEEMTDGKPTT